MTRAARAAGRREIPQDMFRDTVREVLGNDLVIIGSGGLCAFLGAYVLFVFLLQVYRAQKGTPGEIIVVNTKPGLMRSFLPMARGIGMSLRSVFNGTNPKSVYYRFTDNIDRQLTAAGHPEGIIADEFVGFGVLNGLLWSTIMSLIYMIYDSDALFSLSGLYVAGMGFGLGALLWKNWLGTRLRIRQTSIRKQLPFALDLLTLAMEAGLDFTSALARMVVKMGASPLGQEFSLMLHEIQLGKTRSDAMRDFAARCDVSEVRTVVASLVQAEELGSSIGLVLRIQAQQQRERRSQLAEEKAMKAPVKMLFPMVFILGALMLIIGAPIFLMYIGES